MPQEWPRRRVATFVGGVGGDCQWPSALPVRRKSTFQEIRWAGSGNMVVHGCTLSGPHCSRQIRRGVFEDAQVVSSHVAVWDAERGRELARFPESVLKGDKVVLDGLAVLGGGMSVVVTLYDRLRSFANEGLWLWDLASQRMLLRLREDVGCVCAPEAAPEGPVCYMVRWGYDSDFARLDVRTGRLDVFDTNREIVNCDVSPDGQHVALLVRGGADLYSAREWGAASVWLWDTRTCVHSTKPTPCWRRRQCMQDGHWSASGLRAHAGGVLAFVGVKVESEIDNEMTRAVIVQCTRDMGDMTISNVQEEVTTVDVPTSGSVDEPLRWAAGLRSANGGGVAYWEASGAQPAWKLNGTSIVLQDPVSAVRFSPSGNCLIAGDSVGVLRMFAV